MQTLNIQTFLEDASQLKLEKETQTRRIASISNFFNP